MALKPIQILINAKDNASSVFDSLRSKVALVGAAIAGYFGINAFVGVVNGAADLEQAMSRVQAATGATAEEMALLKNAAEGLTDFGGAEAAQALENLGKAGLSAGDAIAALGPSAALAKAGGVSLGVASEALTQVIFGLGLSFKDTGRVADVLAGGANATKTSVEGLTQGLSYAAPVAKSLGLSLEFTVALLGQFAQGGIDASRAGTALNSIMSQFLDPASKFRSELAAAGITTGDFEKALHQLAAAGPAGAKAINAVGLESGPALRAMLNLGMDSLDGLVAKLRDAEGEAARTAAVMRNNLNGSVSSLGKAWEYLTNTLGTPVLPVLKDGVDQLAGAFRAAVADGTVTRFGESIATAFKTGIQFVRDFISTVDFGAVLARLQGFANSANETFIQLGVYATNAGNTVKLAYGVMSAGTSGVLSAIYGIGSVFAEVAAAIMTGVAKLRDGLASITFGELSESFRLAAENSRSAAEGFGDAAQAMRDKASSALADAADSAQLARDSFAGLAGQINGTSAATDAWAQTVAAANAEIAKTAQAAQAATSATEKKALADGVAQKVAQEHAAAIRVLRAEYADLVANGDLQGAALKLLEINKALRETPSAAKDAAKAAEESAAAIAAAYKDLGITTDESLREVAVRAQRSFELLEQSGNASARELADGFADAATKIIAANDGVATSWVTSNAGVRGFRLEADAAGKTAVVAMREAARATDSAGSAARGAAGGYNAMAGAADQAAASAKKLQEIYDRHRMVPSESRVGKSGDVREGAVMQYDINQDIAKRYGDNAVGNSKAEEAWQLRQQLMSYQRNYGGSRSKQSLDQQRNIAAELERVEAELKAELGVGSQPLTRSSGSRSSAGPATGTPTVVNITLGGQTRSVTTDTAGAQALQDLLSQLAVGKSTAGR